MSRIFLRDISSSEVLKGVSQSEVSAMSQSGGLWFFSRQAAEKVQRTNSPVTNNRTCDHNTLFRLIYSAPTSPPPPHIVVRPIHYSLSLKSKTNHSIIFKIIRVKTVTILRPDCVEHDDVLLFLSDAASFTVQPNFLFKKYLATCFSVILSAYIVPTYCHLRLILVITPYKKI